jgi:spore maturation protein CgeB
VRIVYFTHSLASCWNHGNAHFLRGVLRDLARRGHAVTAFEPEDGWSLANLLADHGPAGLAAFRDAYPDLEAKTYARIGPAVEACHDADLVIVHEWSDPALVAALGRARRNGGRFLLLFHDTHHRAVSDPDAIRAFDLDGYDGVLAFGEALAEVYRDWGWGDRCSSGTRPPTPPCSIRQRSSANAGLVWIGNWGDGERTAQIEDFLLAAGREAGLGLDVHGVRYPAAAKALLARYGARYRGWLAESQGPGGLRPPPGHRARAAPLLCRAPARHPDHPGVRGPGLRHPAGQRPLARHRGPVPAGHGLSGRAGRGRHDPPPAGPEP